MSQKSDKKEKQKMTKPVSKNETGPKAVEKRDGKIRVTLPNNLKTRIEAERNPDDIISEALFDYYDDQRHRNEIAVQKEINNNIIEIQRRHISDLKEQLTASNKNYEELMKTYQAYMLQVQPLVENAKLQEAERVGRITTPEEETKTESEDTKTEGKGTKNEVESTKTESHGTQNEGDETQNEGDKTQNENVQLIKPVAAPVKTKKWYEFWK